MFNKVKSLIWLRSNMLMSNKNLVIQIAMPYAFAVIYKQFLGSGKEISLYMLYTCLAMSFAISLGNMLANIISEEKEKKNLKTLILSGVESHEYLLATLFYPVVLGVASIVIFPILIGVDLGDSYFNYLIVTLLTAVAVILLNLAIALVSSTQSKAQVNTLPILFLTSFLPMFSAMNETVETITEFSFMGSYASFFKDMDASPFGQNSFFALISWLIALIILNSFAFKMCLGGKKLKKIALKKQMPVDLEKN